ncbi:alpha/beta fold hydrolase [Aliiglaciecola sp. 2_MG-2023]|uniref:alpha/beta hydrolase family protein n=1 Tax=unclassified Aliiglaciecola TaxID=2593648 RepID=UPI0026E47183|nr:MULTISPECIES: alpha/beta fold hydrolase [unclassified Aliiglaciecola]MDO6711579.1 alpha/beta fold hydrolase [Aliiglaciecola sp. 2_MG-2023]MDO6752650.1 alpha/beta fold hydrolase [Aliiglaciecola sp. 1_MG-2023]
MFKTKPLISFIIIFWGLLPAFSALANVIGSWQGELKVNENTSLPMIVHFSQESDQITATLDSPAQGATGIPINEVVVALPEVSFKVNAIGMRFTGSFSNPDTITGTFTQGSAKLPLVLNRSIEIVKAPERPQTPEAPFDYVIEDVVFKNSKANINLAGTLTKPKGEGDFAAVILISGSGPQDRDETLFGHKPFAVIADYLTTQGLAVLRFDDRGTAQSGGDFATATSEDFVEDVQAAFEFLAARSDIKQHKIGLIGHSEGGMIAPMLASKNQDIAFVVMMAGLGVDGVSLVTQQSFDIQKLMGVEEAALKAQRQQDTQLYKRIVNGMSSEEIHDYFIQKGATEAAATGKAQQLGSPWMRFFLGYQPKQYLDKVSCPILAINGAKDLQVAAQTNLAALNTLLTANNHADFTIKSLPNLNHLFQNADTGLPNEYASIEQTMDTHVLVLMAEWINARI